MRQACCGRTLRAGHGMYQPAAPGACARAGRTALAHRWFEDCCGGSKSVRPALVPDRCNRFHAPVPRLPIVCHYSVPHTAVLARPEPWPFRGPRLQSCRDNSSLTVADRYRRTTTARFWCRVRAEFGLPAPDVCGRHAAERSRAQPARQARCTYRCAPGSAAPAVGMLGPGCGRPRQNTCVRAYAAAHVCAHVKHT